MIPRFTNPHGLLEDVQVVSRAVIDAEHDVPSVEHEDDNADALAVLERIVKRSLQDVDLPAIGEGGGADGPHRMKKRRKLDTKTDDMVVTGNSLPEESVRAFIHSGCKHDRIHAFDSAFRLVGHSPRLLSLRPKPPPEIKYV